jgi:hypothetical protein
MDRAVKDHTRKLLSTGSCVLTGIAHVLNTTRSTQVNTMYMNEPYLALVRTEPGLKWLGRNRSFSLTLVANVAEETEGVIGDKDDICCRNDELSPNVRTKMLLTTSIASTTVCESSPCNLSCTPASRSSCTSNEIARTTVKLLVFTRYSHAIQWSMYKTADMMAYRSVENRKDIEL